MPIGTFQWVCVIFGWLRIIFGPSVYECPQSTQRLRFVLLIFPLSSSIVDHSSKLPGISTTGRWFHAVKITSDISRARTHTRKSILKSYRVDLWFARVYNYIRASLNRRWLAVIAVDVPEFCQKLFQSSILQTLRSSYPSSEKWVWPDPLMV